MYNSSTRLRPHSHDSQRPPSEQCCGTWSSGPHVCILAYLISSTKRVCRLENHRYRNLQVPKLKSRLPGLSRSHAFIFPLPAPVPSPRLKSKGVKREIKRRGYWLPLLAVSLKRKKDTSKQSSKSFKSSSLYVRIPKIFHRDVFLLYGNRHPFCRARAKTKTSE